MAHTYYLIFKKDGKRYHKVYYEYLQPNQAQKEAKELGGELFMFESEKGIIRMAQKFVEIDESRRHDALTQALRLPVAGACARHCMEQHHPSEDEMVDDWIEEMLGTRI